jgi:hypothetical protein
VGIYLMVSTSTVFGRITVGDIWRIDSHARDKVPGQHQPDYSCL